MNLLEIRNISKRFGGVNALTGVDMEVERGSITALIGPNGAGKTTLFNIVSGLAVQTEGSLFFNGGEISPLPAHKRFRAGIGRTFQTVECFGDMTVRENLLLSAQKNMVSGVFSAPCGFRRGRGEERAANVFVEGISAVVDIAEFLDRPMILLPIGIARRAELARALCSEPVLLLLDEPSSGMDSTETGRFIEIVRMCREIFGLTVLYVEHDMEMVARLSDTVNVLDFGRLIAKGTPSEVYANGDVIRAYLGEAEGEQDK